jgi:citrate lyase alpha subunit
VYNITDGGALDMDGTANGVIVDPAGPALAGSLTDTGTNVLIISTMSTVLLAGAVMTRRWKFAATVPSEPRRIPVRFE